MTELICPQCRSQITDEFGFCPACGFEYRSRPVTSTGSGNIRYDSGSQNNQPNTEAIRNDILEQYSKSLAVFRKTVMESNRKIAILMLAIWVGMAIVLGLFSLFIPDSMLDQYEDVTGLTEDLLVEGAVFLVSGTLALVSLLLCYKTRYYNLAFFSCLASTFATLGFLIVGNTICVYFILCGIMATLRLRTFKELFSD